MSNYPPGVSGNEFAISGPDDEWEAPAIGECPECDAKPDGLVVWQSHSSIGRWWVCPVCDQPVDVDDADVDGFVEPDDLMEREDPWPDGYGR